MSVSEGRKERKEMLDKIDDEIGVDYSLKMMLFSQDINAANDEEPAEKKVKEKESMQGIQR